MAYKLFAILIPVNTSYVASYLLIITTNIYHWYRKILNLINSPLLWRFHYFIIQSFWYMRLMCSCNNTMIII